MKHIWLEKENIYRLIAYFAFGISFGILGTLTLYFTRSKGIFIFFLLLSILLIVGGIAEIKNDIAYDESHMIVKTLLSKDFIDFRDINKIERVFIRANTVNGGGHWRWNIVTGKEKITVPFPDSIENEALNDLFDCIKKANSNIKWNIPANPVTYPR